MCPPSPPWKRKKQLKKAWSYSIKYLPLWRNAFSHFRTRQWILFYVFRSQEIKPRKSGEYGGSGKARKPRDSMVSLVTFAVWRAALSWRRHCRNRDVVHSGELVHLLHHGGQLAAVNGRIDSFAGWEELIMNATTAAPPNTEHGSGQVLVALLFDLASLTPSVCSGSLRKSIFHPKVIRLAEIAIFLISYIMNVRYIYKYQIIIERKGSPMLNALNLPCSKA